MSFSIIIASHGHEYWQRLALSRAYPSTKEQGAEVLIEHDPDATRADVRNRLLERATGDWIVTLDADDELALGYVKAMEEAIEERARHERELGPMLFTPRVSYARNGRKAEPIFWPERDLREGNWMIVGTVAPRDLMLEVGGWRTFTGSGVLNEYDDWDMWIRCVQAGAEIVKVQDAVYIAHIARTSPHRTMAVKTRRFWLEEIRRANWEEICHSV